MAFEEGQKVKYKIGANPPTPTPLEGLTKLAL
jgi:hypothetical protein